MKKSTILIVEDDERFRKMLSFLFVAKGFDVKTAYNGVDAWQYLAESTPSLIILDLVMPEMDGFTLYNKIREQKRLDSIPVIILSGLSSQDISERFNSVDLNRYLRKPFRTADILALTLDALKTGEEESGHYNHSTQGKGFIKADKV